jgi:hypothetical protein
MKQSNLYPFVPNHVLGSDDARTTIRAQQRLLDHYRNQVDNLVQVLARLAPEHGGYFCVRNDKLESAAIRVQADPRDERYTRIEYLGLRARKDQVEEEVNGKEN